jgi:hypothetical protein
LKPVLIIAIVFSITITLVGVVAMTNTTDDTSAARDKAAEARVAADKAAAKAAEARAVADKAADKAAEWAADEEAASKAWFAKAQAKAAADKAAADKAAPQAYQNVITETKEQKERKIAVQEAGDWLKRDIATTDKVKLLKAAAAKAGDKAAARAEAESYTTYGSSAYNAPQAPSTNYGSSAYNAPQAPSTNYGSSEPYVPPKFVTPDKSIFQHDRIEIKEYDSVIIDRKLDIPKINPMPKIPVPLPGGSQGLGLPDLLDLP